MRDHQEMLELRENKCCSEARQSSSQCLCQMLECCQLDRAYHPRFVSRQNCFNRRFNDHSSLASKLSLDNNLFFLVKTLQVESTIYINKIESDCLSSRVVGWGCVVSARVTM